MWMAVDVSPLLLRTTYEQRGGGKGQGASASGHNAAGVASGSRRAGWHGHNSLPAPAAAGQRGPSEARTSGPESRNWQQQTAAAPLLLGLLGWLPPSVPLRLPELPVERAPGSVQLRSSTGACSGCGGCAPAGRRCSSTARYTDRLDRQATATTAVNLPALTPAGSSCCSELLPALARRQAA